MILIMRREQTETDLPYLPNYFQETKNIHLEIVQ